MIIKIGTQIGNWKVISEKFKEDNKYKNTCECICGTIRNVPTWHLNNNKTMGCGCSNTKTRFKSQCVGDLSKSYYNSFKKSRMNKGKTFNEDITMDFLWNLFLEQDKRCALSGMELVLNPRWAQQNNNKMEHIQTASIDRIDNSKGYSIDNIQWVHKDINKMKGLLSDNEFVQMCNTVTEFNKNK